MAAERLARILAQVSPTLTSDPLAQVAATAALLTASVSNAYLAFRALGAPTTPDGLVAFLPVAAVSELAHVALLGDAVLVLLALQQPLVQRTATLVLAGFAAARHVRLLRAGLGSIDTFAAALDARGIAHEVRDTLKRPVVWASLCLLRPYYVRSGIERIADVSYDDDWEEENQQDQAAHNDNKEQQRKHHPARRLDVYRLRRRSRSSTGESGGGGDDDDDDDVDTAAPIFFYVHGGGWIAGDKRYGSIALLSHLAQRGWIVYTVNYRLAPRHRFPSGLADVRKALEWVRNVGCKRYGGDPGRIAVGGESAGGHLALLLALDPSSKVMACVDLYGVRDFDDSEGHRAKHDQGSYKQFITHVVVGKRIRDHSDWYAQHSPRAIVETVDGSVVPPILSIHGTHDSLVYVEDARSFVAALRRSRDATNPAGDDTSATQQDVYVELDAAAHAFNIFPSIRGEALSLAVEAFLKHHLLKAKL